jgi:hypothetical protein
MPCRRAGLGVKGILEIVCHTSGASQEWNLDFDVGIEGGRCEEFLSRQEKMVGESKIIPRATLYWMHHNKAKIDSSHCATKENFE